MLEVDDGGWLWGGVKDDGLPQGRDRGSGVLWPRVEDSGDLRGQGRGQRSAQGWKVLVADGCLEILLSFGKERAGLNF
jgi:hypothetical protein